LVEFEGKKMNQVLMIWNSDR